MKFLRSQPKNAWLLALCAVAAMLVGCQSARVEDPYFSEIPSYADGPAAAATVAAPAASVTDTNPIAQAGRFRVGDTVIVSFSGLDTVIPVHEERIKDDGTITLHLINAVKVAGKTPGELQRELQERYKQYYTRLVVTVKWLDLYFFVGGEVRSPNKQLWTGELTVTQAIQASGDFTDFANKKKVQVTRTDGAVVKVNCIEALRNPQLDPKVLPGDKIHVPRRLW